jgi:hypothetical protein
VLLAAPRRPGAVRRRRDVAVPCDDYFFSFYFFRRYFLRDVLKIRPVVLVTPSFVTEISSCIPRRLFFSLDQMIFVTDLFPFAATFSPDALHPSKFRPYRCSLST